MLPFPLHLAASYLRPRRSFASIIPVVTLCGVMLGVAILMIVLAVMTGFGDIWREKILAAKPHITVYYRGGDIPDPDEATDTVLAVPGVVSATPAIVFPAMVRSEMNDRDPITVQMLGIDPERPSLLMSGNVPLESGVFDPSEDRAVLGTDLAYRLGAYPGARLLCYSPLNLRSNDSLYLPEELKVAGVFNLGMSNIDDGLIVCSLGMAQEILGMDGGANLLQVQVETPERAFELRDAISDALGFHYVVRTWEDEDRTLFNALRTEKTMMFLLLAFIAVVAAFCVSNTLLVITLQKTREIGVLRALGFSRRSIRGAFVLCGLVQCAVGELLGFGLGALVLHNLQRLVALLASCGIEVFPKAVYGLAEIPWRVVPSDVGAVLVAVFVFCFAAAFIPASVASRLDPVKAIHQDS